MLEVKRSHGCKTCGDYLGDWGRNSFRVRDVGYQRVVTLCIPCGRKMQKK